MPENLSAREDLLLRGLVDWVPLGWVHYIVSQANKDAPPEIQAKTLDLIHDLADEGLFVLGDLSGKNSQFVAWETPLDVSMQRIRDVYVDKFDDENFWGWYCWLDLTEKGDQGAAPLGQQLNSQSGD